MRAGMIPILQCPGEIIPGQFGPISRARRFWRNSHARTMSRVGIPSVMQTISSTSASAASMIASAAYGGGTKISEQSALVLSTASCTLLNTGQPSCVVPPFPGVTPPTICVPYSAQALAWNVPSRPVRPCTMTRVDLSTRMLISEFFNAPGCAVEGGLRKSSKSRFLGAEAPRNDKSYVLSRCCHHLLRRIFHGFRDDKVQSRLLQNLSSLLDIRAFQTQHDWQLNMGFLSGLDHTCRQCVHSQNTAKDVDQHCFDILITQKNLESVCYLVSIRAATHVQKIRRHPARILDDVHGRHGQPGAVHHAADVSIQLDVVQAVL